jgi:AAA15 family ATPase/GTPase
MFKNIEINNFRGVKNLKIDDFSKINVFVGPNNSGKTTILEALFMMIGMSNPQLSFNVNSFRNILHSDSNDFRLNFRDLNYNNKIELRSFIDDKQRSLEVTPILTTENIKKLTKKNIDSKDLISSDASDSSGDSGFIDSCDAIGLNFNFKIAKRKYHSKLTFEKNILNVSYDKSYKENLNARFFGTNTLNSSLPDRIDKIQIEKKKNLLIDVLKIIEPNLVDIALSKNRVVYVDIGIDQMIPINLMGYGFLKVCGLIATFLISQDGHLMIDEIENGLHYETLTILWNAIIKAANKYNVQIFLTTHSYEALNVLLSVVKHNSYDKNDFRLFLIQKLKEKTTKCYKYDFESLEANVESGVEFRGRLLS